MRDRWRQDRTPDARLTAVLGKGLFDEVLVHKSIDFMKKAKESGKPFFLWHNTTRMHVFREIQSNDEPGDELRA